MLAEMIDNIPNEEWTKGDMLPAKHVVHIIVGANVFVDDISLDQWDPSEFLGTEARAGGPWNFAPEELWSKKVALSKLDEMRETVERSLARLVRARTIAPLEGEKSANDTEGFRNAMQRLGEEKAETGD